MTTASESLQRALYTVLSQHAGLTALVSGVFDRVPEGAALPYLRFGEARTEDASTATTPAERITLELLIFAPPDRRSDLLAVLEAADAALATLPPLTGGWRCVRLHRTSASLPLREGDRLRRATLRLAAWVEKLPV
jgi:hypothetical protein